MKKFMKAIAFVTVMCLVLSTVAFASVVELNSGKISVTVEGVADGEQVALVITTPDAAAFDTDTILYVNQATAGAEGAEFADIVITDDAVEFVDIYAGYATNEDDEAVKVYDNFPLAAQNAKISLVSASFIDDVTKAEGYDENLMGKPFENTKGSIAWIKINAENVAAGDISGMFWAFHALKDGEAEEDTRYAAGDIAALGLGEALHGDVEIAAAFESTGWTVTGVNAIFNLKGEDVHTATGDKLTEIKGDEI